MSGTSSPNSIRAVTHYYYLEMANDSRFADPGASVTGPLPPGEFAVRRSELNLPDFSRTIEVLE